MNRFSRACAVIATGVLLSSSVYATSIVVISNSIGHALKSSSDGTSNLSSSRNNKILNAAKDDASSFVASSGAIRGAQLEEALIFLRTNELMAVASDDQLAQAIMLWK